MFLTTDAREKLFELTRHLSTPSAVDAALLRLHQYRQRQWPRQSQKYARPLPPDGNLLE